MLKKLVHPSRFKIPLSDDATAESFRVSPENVNYLDTLRLAYSGTLRMLLIKPPQDDLPTVHYQHLEVTGTNLTTGDCFTTPISDFIWYKAVSGTEVCTNLIPDGDMEYAGTYCWSVSGTGQLDISKTSYSYNGAQALEIIASGASASNYTRCLNIVPGAEYEDFLFSASVFVISGYNGMVGRLLPAYAGYGSSNLGYLSCSGIADWTTYDGCFRFYPDATSYFEYGFMPIINDTSIYVDNLSIVPNLVNGGGFMDVSEDRVYWLKTNAILLNNASSAQSREEGGNSGIGIFYTTEANGYITQFINTVADTWYTFTVYFSKHTTGDPVTYKVQLVGVETDTIYYDSGFLVPTVDYKKLETTFKNLTDTHILIKIIGKEEDCYVAFDSVSLVPLAEVSVDFDASPNLSKYYDYAQWYDNPTSSLLISGNSLFSVSIISGTNINPDKGGIGLWYCPVRNYNEFLSDSVIVSGGGANANFAKVYYNCSDYKFYGEIYNGHEWISSGCYSDAQTFVSGTWMHLAFSYDNTIGTKLFIDGSQVGEFYGSWDAQELSTLMSIGSISGSYTGGAEGYYDDIVFYPKALNVDNWYQKTLQNTDYD